MVDEDEGCGGEVVAVRTLIDDHELCGYNVILVLTGLGMIGRDE